MLPIAVQTYHHYSPSSAEHTTINVFSHHAHASATFSWTYYLCLGTGTDDNITWLRCYKHILVEVGAFQRKGGSHKF